MVAKAVRLGPELDGLPDDTEEALLGSMLHQRVIVSNVNSLSRHNKREQRGWKIGNQLKLIVPRRAGRRPYQPSPDIIVHTAAEVSEYQNSLHINIYGPPALAIEICSPATALAHDLDTINPDAKPQVYARIGIPEYLVHDPTGEFIEEVIKAWRMGPHGAYEPWLPDPETGRWHSALGISFAPQGIMLRVYDAAGELIPDNDDMDLILADREAMLAEQGAQLAEQREELAAQRATYEARIAALEAELRRRGG